MFTQQQEQAIIELYNNNFSARYIARKLRLNRQQVTGYIAALPEEIDEADVAQVAEIAHDIAALDIEEDPEIIDAQNNHGQGEPDITEGELLDAAAGI